MMLWRLLLRNASRQPWLTVLTVIGVSLGVAVVSAVDIANEAAQASFRGAAETIAGRASHQVIAGPAGLDETLYRELRVREGFRGCAPVVAGHLQLQGGTFQLIGIDPFAEAPIRSFSSGFSDRRVLAELLAVPGSVLMLRQSAERLGLRRGDRFAVQIEGKRRELLLAGVLEATDRVSLLGLSSLLVTDISSAQELLGRLGRLSRIDLILPPGEEGASELRRISSLLPPGAAVVPAGSRAGALERMTRAFRLNLTALSLLALVVGMFLIYNTMTFSVIRRRRQIGMLRALGVSRGEIFLLVMGDAMLIGVAGTVLGLLGGTLLGYELTRLVTRTINDLYFSTELRAVPLQPVALVKGALLGIAATLAAAFPSALEATGAPPRAVLTRSLLEERRRRIVPAAALAGLLLLLVGGGVLLYREGGIVGGFAGLFAVIAGYSLMVPGAVVLSAAFLRPALGALFGMVGKMAGRGIVVSLSRTGVATAALTVAVAAGIGVGIMVGGFRLTVQSWLESWLQADVYVRSAEDGGGRYRPPLDPLLVERLTRLPGVEALSLSRRLPLEGAGGPTEIFAIGLPEATFLRYPFKEGAPQKAWESFSRGESVLVSEPYSIRHRLALGDRVILRTVRGERSFAISGIIFDYGSDSGIILMSRSAYIRNFDDRSVDGISFYAGKGVTPARLAEEIRKRVGGSGVTVISNRELREATMELFDRTFAITGLLRGLTLGVAFVGILSALMAMQVERARELAVLRAVGLTPGELWGVICGETALIGLIAGLLSLPLGILEALILVYVVNLRSFGWTMQLTIEPGYLLQGVLLSLTAALLAGVYPSLAIARTSPALALKEEE